MRILCLDAALAHGLVALVTDGTVVTVRRSDNNQSYAAQLPQLVDAVLKAALSPTAAVDLIAVTLGPGSFTGLRATLALAHGIAMGSGIPLVGVSMGEALAAQLPPLAPRLLWTAIDTRRGRVFLERDGVVQTIIVPELPMPTRAVALAGDAAGLVAGWLAARGADVMLTDARHPSPFGIAQAAVQRLTGELPPRPTVPLYVDPPEARLPAGGLRPMPI